MATLDDKLLGEKIHNYCSSSEDESEEPVVRPAPSGSSATSLSNQTHWSTNTANTGPKGVIQDWQRFKQLENERREADDAEKLQLMKKLSITTRTKEEDEQAKSMDAIDAELRELIDEDFLLQYQKKRMAEMLALTGNAASFGELLDLKDGDEFLKAIDNEKSTTTVIVHLYSAGSAPCKRMNEVLQTLAKEHRAIKFCKFACTEAGLSRFFRASGVPALLVYKSGQMIGNFVKLVDELSDEFDSSDVEGFLVENGILSDKSCEPILVKNE